MGPHRYLGCGVIWAQINVGAYPRSKSSWAHMELEKYTTFTDVLLNFTSNKNIAIKKKQSHN